MRIMPIIAFACIILLTFASLSISNKSFKNNKISTKNINFYNPYSPPKTFEDLFLPHWLENGTFTFNVPEYMHYFKLAFATTWTTYYQYGWEKGRHAILNISDNTGTVYLYAYNSNDANGTPIGGPGRYQGVIKGDKITINITGKVLLQFGIWGSWTEDILDGGTYSLTFNAGKIALYMDYYNPTNFHTFYFKSSQPLYGYLFGWDSVLLDHTDKPVKDGALTEPYDASPFLTFIRPSGQTGNVTVQFWAGYKEKKSDPAGALVVLGVAAIIFIGTYLYSKREIFGNKRRKRK